MRLWRRRDCDATSSQATELETIVIEPEPVDTTLPWARRRDDLDWFGQPRSVASQTERIHQHARQHPLTQPRVLPHSLMTADYEPNRPAASTEAAEEIIAKKGMKSDDTVEVHGTDKFVVICVLTCLLLMIVVIGATLIKLG